MYLGALDIIVSANFARFQSDMGKVVAIAEEKARDIDKVFGVLSTSLKALGAGFVVGLTLDSIKGKIEGAIAATAALKEVSERTGATVEGLSALAATAKLSGTDLDTLATGLQKLSKALVDAKDGGAKTGAAFAAIGISTKQLIGLKPDEAFLLISNQLAKYKDGAEKTAIAIALFGKAGANLLPVMNDVAVVGKLVVKATTEQAEAALEYEKNLKRLDAVQAGVFKTIGFAITPVLNTFVKALLETATQTGGVKDKVGELAKDNSLRDWAESAATGLAILIETAQGLAKAAIAIAYSFRVVYEDSSFALSYLSSSLKDRTDFHQFDTGPLKEKLDARNKVLKDANAAYADAYNFDSGALERSLAAKFKALNAGGGASGEGDRKDLAFNPNSAAAKQLNDGTKQAYEERVKQIERLIAEEGAELARREKQLDFFYSVEFTSLGEAERAKQKLISDNTAVEVELYDAAIGVARRYLKSIEGDAKKLADIEKAKGEISKLQAAQQKAQETGIEREIESRRKLIKVREDFNIATRENEVHAKASNDAQAFAITLLGQSTLATTKANIVYGIEAALKERIRLLDKQGLDTSERDAAVAAAVAAAEREKTAAVDLATQSYEKQRSAAFGAQEAFRKYSEDAADAATHVNTVFTNAFKGLEDALVNFVKTGKLDFKSLADSIISDIIRIQIKAAIASQTGSSGGFLGLILSAFTGGGSGYTPSAGQIGGVGTGGTGDLGQFANGLDYVPYDGFKAILHKGEKVTPAYQLDASGRAADGGNVYITNNAPAQVSAQKDDNGDWQVLVEAAANAAHNRVAQDVGSGTGRVASAMKSRGLSLGGAIPRRA
jgi:lambda family phage tail tape measure protein